MVYESKNKTIEQIVEMGTNGTAHETIGTALECFLTSTSFAESVIKAVIVGGDTDTRAAITGAIAGAYYGLDGIPQEYLDNLEDSEKIQIYDTIMN